MTSDELARPVRPTPTSRLFAPIAYVNWIFQWMAFGASNLAVFQVLEYAGKLTVLVAVIGWIADYPERKQAAIRAAWSVLNSQGGGRIDSLEYLVRNNVDLKGLFGTNGYFAGVKLEGQDLRWSNLENANFEDSKLEGANLQGSLLSGVSFKNARLTRVSFRYSRLYPRAANFEGADIAEADFRDIIVSDLEAYRMLAAARNWQKALFDETTRKRIACVSNANPTASSCLPSVPDIQETWGRPEDAALIVNKISGHVICELRSAVQRLVLETVNTSVQFVPVPGAPPPPQKRDLGWFVNKWAVQVTLSLKIRENSPDVVLNGSGLSNTIASDRRPGEALLQSSSIGVNQALSSSALRNDKLGMFFSVKELLNGTLSSDLSCIPNSTETLDLLARSDLKLYEWLTIVLEPYITSPIEPNAITHGIKFEVVSAGDTNLRLVTIAVGATPTTKRDSAHDLIITFGPNHDGMLAPPAAGSHLATETSMALDEAILRTAEH
jgi:hypothetical protein